MALGLVVLMAVATAQFAGFVRGLESRLRGTPERRADSLPAPVREFALRGDATPEDLARRVRLTQEAELRDESAGRWMLLEARQVIDTGAAGFVWEAWQDLGPFPKVRVVDAYAAGAGVLRVLLFGALRVVNATGPEVSRGEAMRYLAELPWAPDAILGNAALDWRMRADGWAEVTLTRDDGPVSVRFRFEAGDIVEFRADNRPALVGRGIELRSWQGYFRNYQMVGTRRVPVEGEVGYVVGQAYRPYFQCRVTGCETEH